MYSIYGNIYHQYTPNVSIYTIHGSYGSCSEFFTNKSEETKTQWHENRLVVNAPDIDMMPFVSIYIIHLSWHITANTTDISH